MRKIGLLCGLSYHSTAIYYELINKHAASLNNLSSANILMNSLNAKEVIDLIQANKIKELENFLIKEVLVLEKAGAECVAMTCNTVHFFIDAIRAKTSLPVISIIESVAKEASLSKLKKVGILGTKFSCKNNIHSRELSKLNIDSMYPSDIDMQKISDIIINLCSGRSSKEDLSILDKIIKYFIDKDVDGIILGCTELGLLINQKNYNHVKILDTAIIHANDLAEFMMSKKLERGVI